MHEESHIRDVLRVSPDVCRGKPKGTLVQASNAGELRATEFAAVTVEISCLQRKLKSFVCGDDSCSAIINGRIGVLEGVRDGFR